MNAGQVNRAGQVSWWLPHGAGGCHIMSEVASLVRKWGCNNAINWRQGLPGRGQCKCKVLNQPRWWYPLGSLLFFLLHFVFHSLSQERIQEAPAKDTNCTQEQLLSSLTLTSSYMASFLKIKKITCKCPLPLLTSPLEAVTIKDSRMTPGYCSGNQQVQCWQLRAWWCLSLRWRRGEAE